MRVPSCGNSRGLVQSFWRSRCPLRRASEGRAKLWGWVSAMPPGGTHDRLDHIRVFVQLLFTDTERIALAGFLAGLRTSADLSPVPGRQRPGAQPVSPLHLHRGSAVRTNVMEVVYPPVGIAHITRQIPDVLADRTATAARAD
jgi:hypothetical protein